MYVAHIGPAWHRRFNDYAEAVDYAASYGLPPVFVELNLYKHRYTRYRSPMERRTHA
ncbi:hypothetical protein [Streptomyces scabiei]|uniref:hypothetical protein n=1 Tax=Streptomyces scabiei TaxID=1930 RepID=UPI0029B59715|nr:hypothetical protein [Streptomyces scabiei]MDX3206094.1 hypothetical protein [Streptomyces scabiei]